MKAGTLPAPGHERKQTASTYDVPFVLASNQDQQNDDVCTPPLIYEPMS